MISKWELQRKRITDISIFLRKQYYIRHGNENCYFYTPDGIESNFTESIGTWPEIIFRGTFCRRALKGYCSPCFYSQFPLYGREKGERYNEMIRSQFNYVIDHFDDIIVKHQCAIQDDRDIPISFVLTPSGSYFDKDEFPQKLRLEMLEQLAKLQKNYRKPFHLYIEAHCKDWNSLNFSAQDTITELRYLKELHTTIIFGFESFDDYVRNVLYNKHLSISEINRAYEYVCKFNLQMGVFIFAGLFSMNDKLTFFDVVQSLRFAIARNIAPVLMFHNIQQYTIVDFLFQARQISLLEPFTVMDIIVELGDMCKKYDRSVDWLIADPRGGPPVPEFNIFECAQITSTQNSNIIYQMICDLRLTRDFDSFITNAELLRTSQNYSEYRDYFNLGFNWDYLEQNTNRLLDYVENHI